MSQVYKNRTQPVLIELRPSKIYGVGVFAVERVQKDQKIANGLAEEDFETLISWSEFDEFDIQTRKKIWDFCIGTPEGFVPPENLDFNKLSIEWYFNHSCDCNVGFDSIGDFVAIKNIVKGTELTYDYALAESNPEFVMRCKCGSAMCRKVITGNDWKDEAFGKDKTRYMLPHLQQIARSRTKRTLG